VLAGGDVGPCRRGSLSTFGRVVHWWRCVGTGAARKIVLITAALARGHAGRRGARGWRTGWACRTRRALEGLSSGPLAGAVKRMQSADSDFPDRASRGQGTWAWPRTRQVSPQVSAARDWFASPQPAKARLTRTSAMWVDHNPGNP